MYSAAVRWLSFIIVDAPQQIIGGYVYGLFVYNMVGLDMEETTFYSVSIFTLLISYTVAFFCGLVMPDAMSALVLFGLICSFQICFSGYIVLENDLEPWLQWALPLSFARLSTGQLIKAQFTDLFYIGNIIVYVFSYNTLQRETTLKKFFLFYCVFEALILIGMFRWPSLLRHYEKESDVTDFFVVADEVLPSSTDQKVSMTSFSVTTAENDLNEKLFDTTTSHSLRSSRKRRGGSALVATLNRLSRVTPPLAMDPSAVSSHSRTSSHSKSYTEKRDIYRTVSPLEEARKVDLDFRNITYTITANGGMETALLSGVSGGVSRGQMVALMGPSGAGI